MSIGMATKAGNKKQQNVPGQGLAASPLRPWSTDRQPRAERLAELDEAAGVGHHVPDGLVGAEPRRPRRQPRRPGLVEDRLPGDLLRRPEPPDVRPEDDVQEPDVVAGEEAPPLAARREGLLELPESRGHLLRRLGLVAVDHAPQCPERRRELREFNFEPRGGSVTEIEHSIPILN